jgi:RNA polymerase sigma-70 factor (ECF subfamily)
MIGEQPQIQTPEDTRSDGQISQGEFRRLYDTVFPILFRVAYHIANSEEAAEDLCQEAFFRLYERQMVFPNPEEA